MSVLFLHDSSCRSLLFFDKSILSIKLNLNLNNPLAWIVTKQAV